MVSKVLGTWGWYMVSRVQGAWFQEYGFMVSEVLWYGGK